MLNNTVFQGESHEKYIQPDLCNSDLPVQDGIHTISGIQAEVICDMLTIDQILKTLNTHPALSECKTYIKSRTTVRIDIPENNRDIRKKITDVVLAAFENSTTSPIRPFDVLIPNKFVCLVKPGALAPKTASGAFFGVLSKIDLGQFDTSSFSDVCLSFSTGKLPTTIKENSDAQAVSDLNEAIERALKNSSAGIDLNIEGHSFKNVIGCVPVTKGEPKADLVLVCRNGYKLYPGGYISYKMGTSAKDFQNYSGLSARSARGIFEHNETHDFFINAESVAAAGNKEDPFQEIQDNTIIGLALWGKDFGVGKWTYGVNNCNFIAQGKVAIVGNRLVYDHVQNNGDFKFSRAYQPVFGARYTPRRDSVGPKGTRVDKYRVGIYPRVYRTEWMK